MLNNQVLIYCKDSLHQHLLNSNLFFTHSDEGLEVIVDNIDSLDDDELCTHYGLDYDQVNCIELI